MRVNKRALLSATAVMFVLLIPSAARAQHTHSGQKKVGMTREMSEMMTSPHHILCGV